MSEYELGCHDAQSAIDKQSMFQTAEEIPLDGESPRYQLDSYWHGVYNTLSWQFVTA